MIPKIQETRASTASPSTTRAMRSFFSFGRRARGSGPEEGGTVAVGRGGSPPLDPPPLTPPGTGCPAAGRPSSASRGRGRRVGSLSLVAIWSRSAGRDHVDNSLGRERIRRAGRRPPVQRSPWEEGRGNPAEQARQSSIGPVTDPAVAERARSLLEGAVDALPEDRLAEQLAEDRPLRVKFGVDPTSPDIHLGHCVVLMKLRAFQDAGHTVVLIIGDYTARVGDPSGRDATRPVLSPEELEDNARTYEEQAFMVLDRDRTELRRNSEWLEMPSDEL